jgi:hypothetical protein
MYERENIEVRVLAGEKKSGGQVGEGRRGTYGTDTSTWGSFIKEI